MIARIFFLFIIGLPVLAVGILASQDWTATKRVLGGIVQDTVTTQNVKVLDGDSLRIDGVDHRLIGIDAPEIFQTCEDARGRTYNCGQDSKRYLQRLVEGRHVTCVSKERDKYKRPLSTCYVGGKGHIRDSLNASLLTSGWAFAFRSERVFVDAEAVAKSARRGVWQGKAQKPQAFRDAEAERHTTRKRLFDFF